jgi:DNA-binding MarR family transcriptional regulator
VTESHQTIAKQIDEVEAALARVRLSIANFDESAPDGEVSATRIRGIMRARRRREAIFGTGIFADPGWDMLLGLFAVELEGVATTVTTLCSITHVPNSTALRWLERLAGAGLVLKSRDTADRRRTFVKLSPLGVAAMERFFREPASKGIAI